MESYSQRTHIGEKYCDYSVEKSSIQILFPLEHIIHTGEKSLEANECERAYKYSLALFNIKETMQVECL